MNLYTSEDGFNNLQLLKDLKNKRNKLDNTIDSLEKLYSQKQFLTSEEVQELEATLYDNNVADGIPVQRYITPSLKNRVTALNVSFRINVEQLSLQNLSTTLYALSELSTKYWLISKGRFADLIEYTQTHNPRFTEEATIQVTKITYNSPVNIDLSIPGIAQALVTTLDGVTQVGKRLRKAELEIREKEQALEEAQQKADQAKKIGELEQEKQQLELEKQRLELQKQTLDIQMQQLELQKKSFEYAIEMATKVVDMLRPGVDPDTRAMAVQAILPNWIQLQNAKGLELVLPSAPPTTKSEEDKK